MLRLCLALVGVISVVGLSAQQPEFDAVSVKINKGDDQGGSFYIRARTLTIQNNTLRALVRNAWNLNSFEVVGGPKWADETRFDIVATIRQDVSWEQLLAMTQRMLADSFGLKVHHEEKPAQVYALVMSKPGGSLGPQIRKSTMDCPALIAAATAGSLKERPAPPPPLGDYPVPVCSTKMTAGTLASGGMHMSDLARELSQFVGRRVLDQTGLPDAFDFVLRFNPNLADGASTLPSVVVATQEQLGLRLEPRTASVDVLVIDSATMPSMN